MGWGRTGKESGIRVNQFVFYHPEPYYDYEACTITYCFR